jgi:hypothetical protein
MEAIGLKTLVLHPGSAVAWFFGFQILIKNLTAEQDRNKTLRRENKNLKTNQPNPLELLDREPEFGGITLKRDNEVFLLKPLTIEIVNEIVNKIMSKTLTNR